MILLDANPLENLRKMSMQDGVMLHGRWFPEDKLQKNLVAAAAPSEAEEDAK